MVAARRPGGSAMLAALLVLACCISGVPAANLLFSVTNVTVSEANSMTAATYTVRLDEQPTGNVNIIPVIPTVGSTPQAWVQPPYPTFSTSNWDTEQTIRVLAFNDYVDEDTLALDITHTATSADPRYSYDSMGSVVCYILDDDNAAIKMTASAVISVTESSDTAADVKTYEVQLDSQPTDDVVVSLNSSSSGDLTVTPAALTFTASTWNTPQAVSVQAPSDNVVEDAIEILSILHTATSADPKYAMVSEQQQVQVACSGDAGSASGWFALTLGGFSSAALPANATASEVGDALRSMHNVGAVSVAVGAVSGGLAWNVSFLGRGGAVPLLGVTNASLACTAADGAAAALQTASSTEIQLGSPPFAPAASAVTVQVTDDVNVVAGVFLTKSAAAVAEGAGTDTYSVRLRSNPDLSHGLAEPFYRVTVTIVGDGELTVSPATLTFGSANWDTLQEVTVGAVDDLIAEDSEQHLVVHQVASGSPRYQSVAEEQTVAVSAEAADLGGTFNLGFGGAVTAAVAADATAAEVQAALQALTEVGACLVGREAIANGFQWNVTFSDTPGDLTLLSATASGLTGTAPGVTVRERTRGVPAFTGGAFTSSGAVVVTVTDNDIAGVQLSTMTLAATESAASPGGYTVALRTQPTALVTVTIAGDYDAQPVPNTLVFNETNWATEQGVTAVAMPDSVAEETETHYFFHSTASGDGKYASQAQEQRVVVGGAVGAYEVQSVTTTSGATGGGFQLAFQLESEAFSQTTPSLGASATAAEVKTALESLDSLSQVSVTRADLSAGGHQWAVTFLEGSWNGDLPLLSAISALSGEGAAVSVAEVTAGSLPIGGSFTLAYCDSGTENPFRLCSTTANLTAQVTAPALRAALAELPTVASDGLTVAKVASAEANSFTVTLGGNGGNNAVLEVAGGGLAGTDVTLSAAITSPGAPVFYDQGSSVRVTVTDDGDAARVVISEQALAVTEGGANASYTVALSSNPDLSHGVSEGDYVVVVTVAGDADVRVEPPALTFTGANWNQTQTVLVSAVDDFAFELLEEHVVMHSVASANPQYNGSQVVWAPQSTVAVSVTSDDVALIKFSKTELEVQEGGATDAYEVTLTSQPTSVVTVTAAGPSDLVLTPESLVFTPEQWMLPQTVRVAANNDHVEERGGAEVKTIINTATSADEIYNVVAEQQTISMAVPVANEVQTVTSSVTLTNEQQSIATGVTGADEVQTFTTSATRIDEVQTITTDAQQVDEVQTVTSSTGVYDERGAAGPDLDRPRQRDADRDDLWRHRRGADHHHDGDAGRRGADRDHKRGQDQHGAGSGHCRVGERGAGRGAGHFGHVLGPGGVGHGGAGADGGVDGAQRGPDRGIVRQHGGARGGAADRDHGRHRRHGQPGRRRRTGGAAGLRRGCGRQHRPDGRELRQPGGCGGARAGGRDHRWPQQRCADRDYGGDRGGTRV